MELKELVKNVKFNYQKQSIDRCRYNALDKVVAFLVENNSEVVKDVSLLKNINKKQLKDNYEQSKEYKILNGAENQAINDLYNNL